jgi:hypothetical protein
MIDVSKLDMPEWVRWVAQDADGAWWGYEVEPLQHDNGWYENEVGRNIKLPCVDRNNEWRATLKQVRRS